jgi:hypothetical protein
MAWQFYRSFLFIEYNIGCFDSGGVTVNSRLAFLYRRFYGAVSNPNVFQTIDFSEIYETSNLNWYAALNIAVE